jgi:4-hydroxybenzoate polyprenyltransferase
MKIIRAYMELMRLNRPIGIWLLLFPCLWSLALASPALNLRYIFLFTLGAILMRGAGCTFNDIMDRDIDKYVKRTKDRPLAKGALSIVQGILLLILQLCGALTILLQFNKLTQILGACSLILVAIYPFMKRYTYWPQLFLGITFNWGAFMGEMALYERITFPSILLYITCIFWTLAYDTLYAYQDYKDDLRIGVKSTACRFGDKGKGYITLFYGVMLFGWGTLSIITHKLPLLMATLFGGILLFLWRRKIHLKSPLSCLQAFKKNLWIGLIFYAGILIANLLEYRVCVTNF